jgi:hypothetical protein
LLRLLFAESEFNQAIVFKGGTSLSKVFGVIHRFSEDIDLSLSPAYLGIPEDQAAAITSRTQRDAWMERLQRMCATAVQDRIQPAIENRIRELLAPGPRNGSWTEFVLDPETESPVQNLKLIRSCPTKFDFSTTIHCVAGGLTSAG